ncbi:MAG: hypothetical protein AABZ35_03680, partial [Gemmatimonadota bacterium]
PEIASKAALSARRKVNSARVPWDALVDFAPEKLVLIPCGFDIDRTKKEMHLLTKRPECVTRMVFDPSMPQRELERMAPDGHQGRILLDDVLRNARRRLTP